MTLYILIVTLAAIFALAIAVLRCGSFGSFLPSAISGLLGLCAVYISSFFGAAMLAINLFTVSVSAFFGIPGVISLLMLRLISTV